MDHQKKGKLFSLKKRLVLYLKIDQYC